MSTPRPAGTRSPVSRRAVAQGLAWSVPAVAATAAAPAFAASPTTVGGSACSLFYGAGGTNNQTHEVSLGVTSTTGIIPAGTVLTWTITVGADPSGRTSGVPTTNYSANDLWDLTLSPSTGSIGTLTATMRFNQDYNYGNPGGTWCAAQLVWNDTFILRPRAPMTVTSNGATTAPAGVTSAGTGTLAYTVAKRHPNSVNTTGRQPHVYTSKSGTQECYPAIGYSRVLNSNGTDNVTTYPAGVTPPGDRGAWDGRYAWPNATGQSSPAYRAGAASGQWNQPAVC